MDIPKLSADAEEEETHTKEEKETYINAKRMELIKLSEEGEISQSVKHIKKASDKVIAKIHSEYEFRQMDKTNSQLADDLIVKFSELMGELDVVDNDGNLTNELRSNKLLQRDVKSVMKFITPFVPFIGLLIGVVILGKFVMMRKGNKPETTND